MKTILLVDDDSQLRSMFRTALKNSGYNVLEANSGVSGLEMARKHLPDLILSDIHMPGGDGTTLLRDIRHDPELRTKQVVLMTGRSDLISPRKGMEEGADDFLEKPVSLQALKNCMEARFSRISISWRVEDQVLTQLRSSMPEQLPHEFFTPLAGIIGLTEILSADFAVLPPKDMKDIIHDVHQSALRLHRTLRNYLLILEQQSPVTDSSLPLLSAEETEKSIRLGIEESLRLNDRRVDTIVQIVDGSISIKPEDLSHIVEELTDNAYKFSRHGTPVKVEFGAGKLTISDQGRGMTAEKIARIGAFQQFDRKKHEQQGLGLGLVLVQKITAGVGAACLITSQPGEGTRVEVTFPSAATGASVS
jgi:two-component system sensor histidine kinase/response regulator